MESDSDGEMEEFSGMELPPLINSLKKILSEYPDGGQIIKELIQNAEDAGATEVKLLYDGRNINQDPGKGYRKFFKGPALCLYNNAIFEETDWKGIRMIEMSVKESEPLKVGKFGLGFKSIFHMTDYPCVLSGRKLLLIDPQQPNPFKVNAMMDLGKLAEYKKRMDVDAFFKALDGTFGVSRDIISKGLFEGTLFWFPLRQTPSKISSNLYDEKKVMALFDSIESEHKSLLIFLKSLTHLSLSQRTMSEGQTDVAVVEVSNASEISKEREEFRKKIVTLSLNPSGPAVQSTIKMTVQCSAQASERTWLVVNYFMGNNASPAFMTLIKDKDLASSPYVSVAAPISTEPGDDPLEGHIFCFMPLPREGTSLTGLPVHVNGFFALNQSRHHVKWLTDEQRQQNITDKDVLWNKHLITEALPVAYDIWIKEAVKIANHHQNDLNNVKTVHNSLPVKDSVKGKWQELLKPLFCKIKEGRFLYSDNQQMWVTREDALFTSPTDHPPSSCNSTVIKALTQMKKYHVDITDDQVETIKLYMSLHNQQLLTPELFSQFLKANNSYQSMSRNEKMDILQYLLKNDDSCKYLRDLELLPVASGEWKTFHAGSAEKIYKCTSKQLRLFPGLEDRFLPQESEFPATLFSRFDSMCKQGAFQLTVLSDNNQSEIEMLLQTVIETQIPGTPHKNLQLAEKLNLPWLQEVWEYIISKGMISICQSVPLLPMLKGKNWINADVDIVKLSSTMILAEHGGKKLPDDVRQCLKSFDVVIVPSLPEWIPMQPLQYLPDKDSVIQLLTHVQQTASPMQSKSLIKKFNESTASCRREFMLFLHSAKLLPVPCINLIRELKMFPGRDSLTSSPDMFSFNQGLKFTTVTHFPIPYPTTLLDGFDEARQFLMKLGAKEISFTELILLSLQNIQNGRYSQGDERKFMEFFVQRFHEIQSDKITMQTIKGIASMVPFIKCNQTFKRPSDLFNPTDNVLQDLFIAESMFPDPEYDVKILLQLGLKNRDNLTAEDLVTTAKLLDAWSKSNKKSEDVYTKAKALMKVITLNPEVLRQYVGGNILKSALLDLECVEFKTTRTPTFPKWLPWYSSAHCLCKPTQAKHVSVVNIVGSVMPVVESESKAVTEAFCWETNIPEDMLIAQFAKYKEGYRVTHEADLLAFLRRLYKWLMSQGFSLEKWKNLPIIWVRDSFCIPKGTIVDKDQKDINLVPHFHYVADTFSDLPGFFLSLGCYKNQSIEVLLITLTNIVSQNTDSASDLNLAVSVIRKLAERKDELSPGQTETIPLPVHSPDKLCFKPLIECTFSNNPDGYLFDEEEDDVGDEVDSFVNLNFVSSHITEVIAKSLGVKTLQRRTLMHTEELAYYEEWGQEEELTTRLKTLIERGYKDGLSVPQELLQNADDAGAKCIKFLYDERENLDAQESLLDKGMKSCQGPALWVYNDAKFTDEDFKNIRKLNGATKENNVRTIGKFGLGFCSVYNLTDVPSFVSGSNIVILDPHKSHLGDTLSKNSPGLKIDLSRRENRMLCKRNKDQFKPYLEVFGCDILCQEPYYDGTLFRLPFRTHDQAKVSEIRSDPYSKKDVLELLNLFVSTAGNLLLFTQNVQKIEVYHLPPSAKSAVEQELMFRVTRDCLQWNRNSFSLKSESILSQMVLNAMEISEIQKVHIQLDVCKHVEDINKTNVKQSPTKTSSDWIVSWATGTRESKRLASQMKNVIPLAAIAVPCDKMTGFPKKLSELGRGFYEKGRLYCFLPIPGPTEVEWHMHGCFDVTEYRTQLKHDTEQDRVSLHIHWNEQLMSDAAVIAFVKLLVHYTKIPRSDSYLFHTLWPVQPCLPMQPFTSSFFRYIAREDVRIFEGYDGFHSFNEIIFLDSNIRDSDVGSIAFDMLVRFPPRDNLCVIDIPNCVMEGLMVHNDKATTDQIYRKMVRTTELLSVFLKNIEKSYWNTRVDDRNKMTVFALSVDDPETMEMLKQTKCIPCEHSETLKMPNELIHPYSDVSSMFKSSDGMFPSSLEPFRNTNVLQQLVKLGMMDSFLPIDLVQMRCQTVETLAEECCTCALDRIKTILNYLNGYKCSALKKYNENEIKMLKDIDWLPVKSKPSDWPFSWFSDLSKELKKFKAVSCKQHNADAFVLTLGRPQQLYRQQDQAFLASVGCLIDANSVQIDNDKFWYKLGISNVDNQQHCKTVVEQLCVLSEEYNNNPKQLFTVFNEIYYIIIRNINSRLEMMENQQEEYLLCIKSLDKKAVVLINNDKLVTPNEVAFDVETECYPHLCKLPASGTTAKQFYRAIGVKTKFTVANVVEALQKNQGRKTKVTNEEGKFVIKLLQNCVDAMEFEEKQYDFYEDFHDIIKGPDKCGNLYPTCELVMEDETFSTLVDMKIMHEDFTKSLGEKLGMKSKKRKCVEEISFAIPWGQQERLVTRLQGLLKEYPCDVGIMKELLQNSDDAGAKELHFIKDYRTHSTENIFGSKSLQGPALCVYNDSYFTHEDLRGIQQLGIGSKQADPSKTGQYGVGFNAVYHLTDTPSFLTKGPVHGDSGLLCMLDPLCANIHVTESNPGIKLPADKVKANFPDVLLGYLENDGFFQSGKALQGTMFRFPLRWKESELSSGIMAPEQMNEILNGFIDEMFNALLFVKSVKTVKISNISSSTLIHEYTVSVSISKEEETKRTKFFDKVEELANQNKDSLSRNLDVENFEVAYTLQLQDSREHSQKWLIVQRFGFPEGFVVDKTILDYFAHKELGHLPLGGVAVPYPEFERVYHQQSDPGISSQSHATHNASPTLETVPNVGVSVSQMVSSYSSKQEHSQSVGVKELKQNSGQLFTFLPLPVLTGFPVHINGHFSLDHSRRGLWDEGYRKMWNELLGQAVIAPSWISAIRCFHLYFTSKKLSEMKVASWVVINKMMECYHNLFPLFKDSKNDFSKEIVRQFYNIIFKEESPLFPVVKEECKRFSVSWVTLKSDSRMFGAVFNNIRFNLRHGEVYPKYEDVRKDLFKLEGVLKDVGMLLIKSPMSIHETVVKLKCPAVPTASPSFVMEFLKTFQSDQTGACSIGEINSAIEKTKIGNIDRLKCLVSYISKAPEFSSKAEQLPVLLTADNILHQVCTASGIYYSIYAPLLPASKSVFLHEELLYLLYHEELSKNGLLKLLGCEDFHSMLEKEDVANFSLGSVINWNKNETNKVITPAWIDKFFTFVVENTGQDKEKEKETFLEQLFIFEDWSFLPAVFATDQHKLLPIHLAYSLFLHRGEDLAISRVVKKIGIPNLDLEVFSESSVKTMVKTILTHTGKPEQVLKCLSHHINGIVMAALTTEEAETLLTYFESHVLELKSQLCIHNLRNLPLYCTQQSTLVHLNAGDILVLPGQIPVAGLQYWALGLNKVLLKQTDRLSNLYKLLGLQCANVEEFYVQTLLPQINLLPQQYWLDHVIFMKQILNTIDIMKTQYGQLLLARLKTLPFINVGNKMKRASDLYWPHNKVFSHMRTETDFPPNEMRTDYWKDLFKILDMKFDVTDELLLQFASEIADRGREHITDDTRKKSDVLLSFFLKNTIMGAWDNVTYKQIKRINFMCPYEVSETLNEIFPQPYSVSRLICFENSATTEHANLCWTSMDILSQIPWQEHIISLLGICTDPPADKVVLHCQNVCIAFQEKLQLETVSKDLVKTIMNELYEFFQKNIDSNRSIFRRLDTFPVIYLLEHSKLVQAKSVVIELSLDKEIKPYLFKAPVMYGQFFSDVFVKLGAKEKLELSHCVYVLQQVQLKAQNKCLLPEELDIAKRALLNLISVLKQNPSPSAGKELLFLPNREHVLVDSRNLTVSDNEFFEMKLENEVSINYFIGFDTLRIKHADPVVIFSKLPQEIQPAILSKCVQSRVKLDEVEEIEDNVRAIVLEEFMHSDELINGILRLVKYEMLLEMRLFDENYHVSQITDNIRMMKVVCISQLTCVLMYKGHEIPGSEFPQDWYIGKGNTAEDGENLLFYIRESVCGENCSDLQWVLTLIDGLTELIQQCTLHQIKRERFLFVFFSKFEQRSDIGFELDKHKIPALYFQQTFKKSAFPIPGNPVPDSFLPFLIQAISPFREEEYAFVAMELEDSSSTNDTAETIEAVYIYVRIMRELTDTSVQSDLRRTYLVDTGPFNSTFERTPIYRLYRFVRQSEDAGAAVVPYDSEPVTAVAFDETCRRIRDDLQEAWELPEKERRRIIMRLRMRWHPDRNPHNQEYCSRVFNYISSVVLLLERGERVSSVVDDRTGRDAPDMSQSAYHSMVLNIDRRASAYTRAYIDNLDDYNRSSNTGRYSHIARRTEVIPDIAEAKRWMRQAKQDYKSACAYLSGAHDVGGFNWVCYTCHQACEKALRAAHYSRNANDVPTRSHSLRRISLDLGADIFEQVRSFESRLSDYNRMRYPNAVAYPDIPSELFSQDDANFALENASDIIDKVEECFDIS